MLQHIEYSLVDNIYCNRGGLNSNTIYGTGTGSGSIDLYFEIDDVFRRVICLNLNIGHEYEVYKRTFYMCASIYVFSNIY